MQLTPVQIIGTDDKGWTLTLDGMVAEKKLHTSEE